MDWTNIFNTSHITTTLIQCMPHFCSKVLPDHTKGLSSSGAFRKTWRCWLGWDRGKNKTSCFSGSLMLDGRKWGWWMGPHQSGQQTNITHPLFRIKSVSLWACCAMREGVNEMEGPVGVKNDQSLIHDPPPPSHFHSKILIFFLMTHYIHFYFGDVLALLMTMALVNPNGKQVWENNFSSFIGWNQQHQAKCIMNEQ